MNTTLRSKFVKIRKDRQCFSCYRISKIGVQMFNWVGIWEGAMCSSYMCETCRKISDILPSEEDGYPEGWVKEMLVTGQSPEDLLTEITKEKK